MKNLEKFEDFKIEDTQFIEGGVNIKSPSTVRNIDEAMDLYWKLFDLGIRP